jgi:mono/diheme cytochrome c family protein
VKNLLSYNCVTCHKPGGQQPTPNFQDNCAIQTNATLIKTRAVDQGTMPPTGALSQADKDKITSWVAAGGRITD